MQKKKKISYKERRKHYLKRDVKKKGLKEL